MPINDYLTAPIKAPVYVTVNRVFQYPVTISLDPRILPLLKVDELNAAIYAASLNNYDNG